MSEKRKPMAFKIETKAQDIKILGAEQTTALPTQKPARKPRATSLHELLITEDVFDTVENHSATLPEIRIKRSWSLGKIALSAAGLLLSLAVGLWVDALIRNLFSRSQILGYVATAILAFGLIALLILIARELSALARLKANTIQKSHAAQALANNDAANARAVVDQLEKQLTRVPQTARGRQILASTRAQVVDGADLIRLAEHTLLKPLDDMAQTLILNCAKRVSLVTALSPRAIVDIVYVCFETTRLISRLATLYGTRPGALGLIRLSKNVIAHLSVTGSIAVGDSLIQQIVGHSLAAKISTRLGEGVINGLMTARVGIAALDLVRPLEFNAEQRPALSDILSELTRLSSRKPETEPLK